MQNTLFPNNSPIEVRGFKRLVPPDKVLGYIENNMPVLKVKKKTPIISEVSTEKGVQQISTEIILGDCLEVLKKMSSNSVDLIVTSPQWPNYFMDSWDRLLQFNKARDFNMYQKVA